MRFWSVTEAAAELGCSRQLIQRWVSEGAIPAERVGRAWVLTDSALEAARTRRRRRST